MYAMVRNLGGKKQERGAGRNQLSRGAYCLDKRLAPRVKEVRKKVKIKRYIWITIVPVVGVIVKISAL